MKRKKLISLGLIGVLLLTAIGAYFVMRNGDEMDDFQFPSVEVTEVRRGSIVRRITVIGVLLADQRVDIKSEIRGKISKVNFDEGTYVSKGAVLVEIEDSMYQAKLKEAEGDLKYWQAEYARQKTLAAGKAGLGKKLDEAIGRLQQAEGRYEAAQVDLEHTKILAPFDGYVGLQNISVGASVNEQKDLLTLVDMDPIKVDFRLPATHIQRISRGQDVKVTIDGFPGQMFKATIDSIDSKVDPLDHSIEVRAVIPNKRAILKPGLFGRVRVVVGAKDGALLIPESAVLSSASEEYVYVVRESPLRGKMTSFSVKQAITTGLSEAGTIEVLRGLSEGDRIVTVGLSKAQDGQPINIVEEAEEDEDEDEDEDDE
ncbi:MAG: efflux RND transporter periplasmic adaptor subunit [Pseudomonadota bacterium]